MSKDLSGKRILVIEDEYLIAVEISETLRELGASIVGPYGSTAEALNSIKSDAIDIAVLDINLRGDSNFAAADLLADSGIPFVFATGYDQDVVPARHAGVGFWTKPFDGSKLAAAVTELSDRAEH